MFEHPGSVSVRLLLLSSLFLLAAVLPLHAGGEAELTSDGGSWTVNLSPLALVGGPGGNFPATVTEPTGNLTRLTFDEISGSSTWRIRMRLNPINWPAGLTLWARRISNHAGVTGGTTFVQVTTTQAELFRATEDASNIEIEFEIRNLGVDDGQGNYSATVTWTTFWI